MNRKMLVTVVVTGAFAVAVSILPLALAQAGHGSGHSGHTSMKQADNADSLGLGKIHSKHIPMVMKTINEAKKASASGDKSAVMAELNKAQNMLLAIHAALDKHVPQFANGACPIMGTPIDPAKVKEDLTREYKDGNVAFCCGGCPERWDKLTDAQKSAKLAKAKPASQEVWTCSMHPQFKVPEPGLCPLCNMKLVPASKQ